MTLFKNKLFVWIIIFTLTSCGSSNTPNSNPSPSSTDTPDNGSAPDSSVDENPLTDGLSLTTCLSDSTCFNDIPVKVPASELIRDWTISGKEESETLGCATIFPVTYNHLPIMFDVRVNQSGCDILYLDDYAQVLDEAKGECVARGDKLRLVIRLKSSLSDLDHLDDIGLAELDDPYDEFDDCMVTVGYRYDLTVFRGPAEKGVGGSFDAQLSSSGNCPKSIAVKNCETLGNGGAGVYTPEGDPFSEAQPPVRPKDPLGYSTLKESCNADNECDFGLTCTCKTGNCSNGKCRKPCDSKIENSCGYGNDICLGFCYSVEEVTAAAKFINDSRRTMFEIVDVIAPQIGK